MTPSDLGLWGRRILVTGAAQGLGQATALWLAGLGADVVAADLRDCTETVSAGAGRVTARHIDLADGPGAAKTFEDVDAEAPLWGLVNAAALLLRRPTAETTEAEISRQIAVNQSGAFFLARAAMARMIAGGEGGRILMFTSQGAFTGGFHGSIPYSMTKAAVTAMVKALAREGAPHGVTVNAIAPGGADTPMLRDGMTPAALAAFQSGIPMGRIATPDEIAAPAAFLLSVWAGYITGTTLHVNGGQFLP
jgi:NAD(P)-dependent dehydrogenase (short-subunit alcohol dehydrogenase family)